MKPQIIIDFLVNKKIMDEIAEIIAIKLNAQVNKKMHNQLRKSLMIVTIF